MLELIQALIAASGLPALDDVEGWRALGVFSRKEGAAVEELRASYDERLNDIAQLTEEVDEIKQRHERAREVTAGLRVEVAELKAQVEVEKARAATFEKAHRDLQSLFDKLTLSIPSVAVLQAVRSIIATVEKAVPPRPAGAIFREDHGEEALRWHPILRSIGNDARRALAAMEGK